MCAHAARYILARMRSTVIVPSYRRHHDLARCLAALRVQRRAPHSVIVALRDEDTESVAMVDELSSSWPELRSVIVQRRGVVAAMTAALGQASGDFVALTDDDAEPAEDWLERIAMVFAAEAGIGGVGGRDDQSLSAGERSTVGRLQWFGRIIGNHHLGAGPARDVDILKGVNCAFRLAPLCELGFDHRLRGDGAQVHWELSLCLSLRRAGWRLRYDPAIRVRHRIGIRHDADQLHRGRFDPAPHADAVFNETLILANHLRGWRRLVFVIWAFAVGTAEAPGVLQLPRVLVRDGRMVAVRWRATLRGRTAGLAAARLIRA